ncbi:hypothetical protein [Microbacterium invictum]|uniref:Alkylation response protein AidB-like acyl-CoA dehydrogenase n=1 Tax=Microbacterium invictum TaxID=515415 RepID=A0AA40SPI0_9MICO|nr:MULTISPECIES: hypothetical protein [Microbacterium]MBB4139956.1 alkylation response protein AidB-like acyl-CoA dehydrogenase [Microbacterium invictum]
MTSPSLVAPRIATLEEFDRELDTLLIGVTARAADQERSGTLLRDDVAALQALGFGALRLPVESGGLGLSFEQYVERLIRVAAADSSLAHIYRGHIAFVEGLLAEYDPDPVNNRTWTRRIARGDLIGNAQSERNATADLTTVLERDGDRLTLTGRKYYTTGSIYADWIQLSALDGEQWVGVTVSTSEPGVVSYDDWDGFGQLLTGTGTTTFDRVPVDPSDVVAARENPERGDHIAAVFQLVLLAVVAGIGRAALRDTIEFVRPRRRIFGFAGETLPREDTLVQETVGSVSSAADAAVRLVLSGARDIEGAVRRRSGGGADALGDVLLDVFRLQQVVAPIVLDAITELFEVGGASAVSRTIALDRHWRNARTVHSHNPAAQRRRAIGDFELNGQRPVWRGAAASAAQATDAAGTPASITDDAGTPASTLTQPEENR